MSHCRASSVCAVRVVLSADMAAPLISTLCTLVIHFRGMYEAEEASIVSGAEVYAIFWLTEGIRQEQGEEDAKEFLDKYALLCHSIPNWEVVHRKSYHTGQYLAYINEKM